MADLADTANEEIENRLLRALEQRQDFTAPSAIECESCGNAIPEQRRALGGVKFCIECQSAIENDLKHYKQ